MKQTLKVFMVLGALVLGLSSIDEEKFPFSSTVMADTCMVGGVISTNTTWSTADCDTYVVYGNLLVDEGAKLTIMPSVVVAFMHNFLIEVRGALTARGTASDSIVFTSYEYTDPSAWLWIKFRNASIDSACSLEYCTIEYAYTGVLCDSASPTITHCTIRESVHQGIYVRTGSPRIIQNKIVENSLYGISVLGSSAPTIYGNVIRSNQTGIYAAGSSTLFIEADTITQNTYGIYIYAQSITATIVSCEITDNTGAGINIEAGSPGNNITINNNFISGNDKGGIVADGGDGIITIKNNWISGNTRAWGGGIYIRGGWSATIDSNCIKGNSATGTPVSAGGIYFGKAGSVSVHYNDIVGNSDKNNLVFEVYSGTGESDIQGQHNWWGTTDSVAISHLVYDCSDNFALRCFVFAPFADSPYKDCEAPSVTVTAPNGGEVWVIGTTDTIEWTDSDNIGVVEDSIYYSTDGGSSWLPVVHQTGDPKSYPWGDTKHSF